MEPPNSWMTRQEAADYLRVSVTQLNRLKLPRTILGRSPRYSRVTLDLHLQRGMFTPSTSSKKGGPSRPPSRVRLSPPVDRKALVKSWRDQLRQMSSHDPEEPPRRRGSQARTSRRSASS